MNRGWPRSTAPINVSRCSGTSRRRIADRGHPDRAGHGSRQRLRRGVRVPPRGPCRDGHRWRSTTAWRVADRFDATGQFIELTADEPIDSIDVVQPIDGSTGAAPNRWITAIDVSVDGGSPVRLDLDETSTIVDRPDAPAPDSGHDRAADDRDDGRGTRIRRRSRRHRPRRRRLRRDPHRAGAHDRGHPAAHRLGGGAPRRVGRHADRPGLHSPAGRPSQSLAA